MLALPEGVVSGGRTQVAPAVSCVAALSLHSWRGSWQWFGLACRHQQEAASVPGCVVHTVSACVTLSGNACWHGLMAWWVKAGRQWALRLELQPSVAQLAVAVWYMLPSARQAVSLTCLCCLPCVCACDAICSAVWRWWHQYLLYGYGAAAVRVGQAQGVGGQRHAPHAPGGPQRLEREQQQHGWAFRQLCCVQCF
jgi:hypothetical protein